MPIYPEIYSVNENYSVLGKITYKMISDQNQISKNDLKSSSKSITCEVISNQNHPLSVLRRQCDFGTTRTQNQIKITHKWISNQNHKSLSIKGFQIKIEDH